MNPQPQIPSSRAASSSPDGMLEPDSGNQEIAGLLGWFVVAVGTLILVGWVADVPLLRSMAPHQVQAKANTAIAFLLAGTALVLHGQRTSAVAARVCAALAALLGAATFLQYPAGRNWGLDELFFRDVVNAVDTVHPGRMAPPTALNFALAGAALLLLGTRWTRAATWLALVVAGVAVLGFIGNLYGVSQLVSFGPYTAMAAPTGATFLMLAAGVLYAADSPLVGRLRRTGPAAGFIAALLVLLLLGGAVLRNTRLLVDSNRRVAHTHEVLDRLADLVVAMQDVETASRGYLLTGDPAFLEPGTPAPAVVRQRLGELRRLTVDNPGEQARLPALESLVVQKLALAQRQTTIGRPGGPAVALDEGKRLMDAIRAEIAALRTEEERLLGERLAGVEHGTGKALLSLGAGLGACFVLLGGAFLALRREVHARTRLAAILRRSEESLAVTLNSIGDAVLATDTAGRITLLNPVAEQLTGWTLAAARGRPVAEVFRIINEQTRAPAPLPVDAVLATGEIKGLANHTALIARDGTERAIADSAAPIRDAAGRVLGVVLVFRDVTESRRAQAQLDRFFELSLDFLCIASLDGYFTRASPAVTEILGWSVEEFLARPYMEQIHPDDRESARREVARQAGGQSVMHYECRFQHKDGSWRTLAWRSTPHEGYLYASARDVTEARAAEEQIRALNGVLRQHAAQLEVANQELESFSYSVSHDLRAPLRHVQGYVEMLKRETQGGLPGKAQRYVNTIADAAREMGQLIDDLLAFSRMARTEMTETEVDLGAVLAEVRRGLESDTAGREIRWTVAPLPRVRGDAAMLRQVLLNLLGNAVKYTRRRAVAEIAVGCAGEEAGRTIFCVRDNGAGFDMKYADKLFGVFQRLHRADEFEGTGIGLATVRRIIGRHGGRTWAEARVDAGATFYFTLQPAPAGNPARPAA